MHGTWKTTGGVGVLGRLHPRRGRARRRLGIAEAVA